MEMSDGDVGMICEHEEYGEFVFKEKDFDDISEMTVKVTVASLSGERIGMCTGKPILDFLIMSIQIIRIAIP
jgi:hypothetical protein